MGHAVSSIAVGATAGLVLTLGATFASAAAARPARAPEPIVVVARADMPPAIVPVTDFMTPPTLLAQTVVPTTPVAAVASTPAVVVPENLVRAVTPSGPQPGVLWIIAMGAVLYRIGARYLRVS